MFKRCLMTSCRISSGKVSHSKEDDLSKLGASAGNGSSSADVASTGEPAFPSSYFLVVAAIGEPASAFWEAS